MPEAQDRYRGRPLLAVVESYALDVIGELAPEKQAAMREVTQRVWSGGDDWKATVRRVLAWDASMDREIELNWASFKRAANAQQMPASPEAFARAFGDEILRQNRE
jgi:hypothetical protein